MLFSTYINGMVTLLEDWALGIVGLLDLNVVITLIHRNFTVFILGNTTKLLLCFNVVTMLHQR